MTNTFSVGEAVRFGWDTFKAHSGILLKVVLTLFAMQILSSAFNTALEHQQPLAGLVSVVFVIVNIILGAGYVAITLKLAKGEGAVYRDIVPKAQIVWKYFLASLLMGAILFGLVAAAVAVGVLLAMLFSFAFMPTLSIGLAVGGVTIVLYVFLAVRFLLAPFGVIEGKGVIESYKQSAELTKGKMWKLLGFMFAMALLNILGILCLLVGLLVSVPVTGVMFAHLYQELKK